MHALSTAALLDAWERGLGLSLFQRALTLLSAACPETPPDLLALLPIGQRDSRLLSLRELTFGRTLNGMVECPRCHARLELSFDADDARIGSPVAAGDAAGESGTFEIIVAGAQVTYRLPNSVDLAAIAGEHERARARLRLLRRCVLGISVDGRAITVDAAPAEVLDATVQHMARVDPQGDVRVMFTCPSCHHQREMAFDIASFFWIEVDAWATRTLRDVHALAKAYGWRESDILAMSPQRRRFYLDLAE